MHLHLESELITSDAGIQFGIVLPVPGMPPVEPAYIVKTPFLLSGGDRCGRGKIGKRLALNLQRGSLVNCRHEACTPVSRAVYNRTLHILHHHEGGQVLIDRSQAVSNPTAQRWPTGEGDAGKVAKFMVAIS